MDGVGSGNGELSHLCLGFLCRRFLVNSLAPLLAFWGIGFIGFIGITISKTFFLIYNDIGS